MKLNEVFARKTYRPRLSFSVDPPVRVYVRATWEAADDDFGLEEDEIHNSSTNTKDLEEELAKLAAYGTMAPGQYPYHQSTSSSAIEDIMNGLCVVGPLPRVSSRSTDPAHKAEYARWKGFIEGWYRSLLADGMKEMPADFGEVRAYLK